MSNTTRRSVLKGTLITAAAGATATDLFSFAKAWAADSPWKPEAGAKLQFTRFKRFVQSEDDAFRAILASFTKATGVPVDVVEEGMDDVQPKASVAANTGQGSDFFWGAYTIPFLFADKTLDISDVCEHLGKKYGGWVPLAETYGKLGDKWIDLPVTISGNYINYRKGAEAIRPGNSGIWE